MKNSGTLLESTITVQTEECKHEVIIGSLTQPYTELSLEESIADLRCEQTPSQLAKVNNHRNMKLPPPVARGNGFLDGIVPRNGKPASEYHPVPTHR